MTIKRRSLLRWAGAVMMVAGGVAIIVGIVQRRELVVGHSTGAPDPERPLITVTAAPSATSTPEPIVPTRTPTGVRASATPTPQARVMGGTPSTTAVPASTSPSTARVVTPASTPVPPTVALTSTAAIATPTSTPSTAEDRETPVPSEPADQGVPAFVVPAGERWRLGISLPYGVGRDYDLAALGVGWVMDWGVRSVTVLPDGVAYAQTVRMREGVLRPEASVLTSVAGARPGSLWLIGNEPDVRWQDDVPPDVYAQLYHEAYYAIKAGDPTALIAAGGIAQPSDLRLRYLDLALQSYQTQFGASLPAQGWHIHNYMLREERDSWGVDIPPGISDNTGALYAVSDSGNLTLFKEQIRAFRRWMASRGYGGHPLTVSEFGIPMPADYGYPPEVVATFLKETWRFFLTATDAALGDPNDGGRLVQRWCWFSMAYPDFPTGDLIEMEGDAWTPLGQAWLSMVPK